MCFNVLCLELAAPQEHADELLHLDEPMKCPFIIGADIYLDRTYSRQTNLRIYSTAVKNVSEFM